MRCSISNNFGKKMGRYSYGSKTEADGCQSLSIYWLKKHGYLPKEKDEHFFRTGSIHWSRGGEDTGNIGFSIRKFPSEGASIKFAYTATDRNTGERKSFDYKFQLDSTPCNLGGVRNWFICGLYKEGVFCGRRVGRLFFGGGDYLGCRHCYNLCYASQNKTRTGKWSYFDRFYDNEDKVEKLEAQIKKRTYKGKLTRKYKRLLELRENYRQSARDFLNNHHTFLQ